MENIEEELTEATISIYALIDPRDHLVRYIGQSTDPAIRLKSHLSLAQGSQQKRAWLRDLKGLKLKPTVHILETVKGYLAADEREQYWIGYYLAHGQVLTNFLPQPKLHLLTNEAKREGKTMPQGYLNVTEAARKYNITEKTIRSWITKRLLPAHTVVIRGMTQYAIAIADIEAVITERAMGQEEKKETSSLEQEIRQRITNLEQRVSELERKLEIPQQVIDQAPRHLQGKETTADTSSTDSTLPSGYIPLVDFWHGLPETTITRYAKGHVTHGQWRCQGRVIKTALSLRQQADLYQVIHQHKAFQPCSNCPHV